MRIRINDNAILLWIVMTVSVTAAPATAQTTKKTTAGDGRYPELGLTYSFVHSNAPPGGCGCIDLNGGAATFAWPVRHFALVGDVDITHAGGINGSDSLTLSTFTAGVRYEPAMHYKGLRPFGQVLVGLGHSSGSLSSGNAFAANVGGGINLGLTRHFGLRLIEADYLPTTFSNSSNNHQNNFRIHSGVVLRF
jgi:outer membrane immunogenic protein